MKRITGIVGGIGSGKSVVCRIVSAMGYPVYDTDSRAKAIMDSDERIHSELCRAIHPRAVVSGLVDRPLIAQIVFGDKDKLAVLNSIVHSHVRADMLVWIDSQTCDRCFIETAIPRSSSLDKLFTDAWLVTASTECRIRRVIARSHLMEEQIKSRIDSQIAETSGFLCPIEVIVNEPDTALLPQINRLLSI